VISRERSSFRVLPASTCTDYVLLGWRIQRLRVVRRRLMKIKPRNCQPASTFLDIFSMDGTPLGRYPDRKSVVLTPASQTDTFPLTDKSSRATSRSFRSDIEAASIGRTRLFHISKSCIVQSDTRFTYRRLLCENFRYMDRYPMRYERILAETQTRQGRNANTTGGRKGGESSKLAFLRHLFETKPNSYRTDSACGELRRNKMIRLMMSIRPLFHFSGLKGGEFP
jgi:hypothetical protein